jgi:hypothetical protein
VDELWTSWTTVARVPAPTPVRVFFVAPTTPVARAVSVAVFAMTAGAAATAFAAAIGALAAASLPLSSPRGAGGVEDCAGFVLGVGEWGAGVADWAAGVGVGDAGCASAVCDVGCAATVAEETTWPTAPVTAPVAPFAVVASALEAEEAGTADVTAPCAAPAPKSDARQQPSNATLRRLERCLLNGSPSGTYGARPNSQLPFTRIVAPSLCT